MQHTSLQCLQGCKISKLADPARPDSFPFSPWHWSHARLYPETTILLWPACSAWNTFSLAPISCGSLCKQALQFPFLWQFRPRLWGRLKMHDPLHLFFSGPRHPSYITLPFSPLLSPFSIWLLQMPSEARLGRHWCCQPNTCSLPSLPVIPVGFFIGNIEHELPKCVELMPSETQLGHLCNISIFSLFFKVGNLWTLGGKGLCLGSS